MIVIDSYNTLKLFCQTMASSHPNIKGFILADNERIANLQKSTTTYPLLLLDPPTVGTEQENVHILYYHTRIAIVENIGKDDWTGQEEILDRLEGVMIDCISYMRDSGKIESMGDIEQIQMASPDIYWGWQVQVTFRVSSDFCYNASKWLDTYTLQPQFVSGETQLQLSINTNPIAKNWEAATDTPPIEAIATAINGLSGVQATAATNDITGDYLIITANEVATSINVNHSLSGHTWEKLN